MAMSVMEIHGDAILDLLSTEPHRRLEVKKVRACRALNHLTNA